MLNTIKKYAFTLGTVAVVCTLITVLVFLFTKDNIDKEIQANQQKLFHEVIPDSYFNNNLVESCGVPINTSKYGYIKEVYTARKDGKITAYITKSVAPNGYSGDITLLISFTPSGQVLGVRTLQHNETPGLGDKIETKKSDWILDFTNKKLTTNNQGQWAVKKDGGEFDQFAGATITPRAVVNMVKKTVLTMMQEEVPLAKKCAKEVN